MGKQIIKTDQVPAPVGPYSVATVFNGMVFTAGQVGIKAGEKILAEGIQAQTRQVLENIKAVLEAAGTSLDKVVKTTVFLDSMDDFAAMNEVYAEFFTENHPSRSAVEVARLPLGALVEIETIAYID